MKSLTVPHFQWFLTIQKLSFCMFLFHWFFMFFQNPSRRAFLEDPGADLASNGRFWNHFWFLMGPKIDPWSVIFSKIGLPKSGLFARRAFRDRPWRHLRPKMVPGRRATRISSILDRFPTDFGWFYMIFLIYSHVFKPPPHKPRNE